MHPLDVIVMALALGAIAGLKDSAEQAVKDLYNGFKSLIERKYGDVHISFLETDPGSKAKQAVIREELEKKNVIDDKEVLTTAKQLLLVIQEHSPNAGNLIGLEMKNVTAGLVEIDRIIALEGTGASLSDSKFEEVHIHDVVSGRAKNTSPKTRRR